jgi:hypothetical protein
MQGKFMTKIANGSSENMAQFQILRNNSNKSKFDSGLNEEEIQSRTLCLLACYIKM